jgi:Spy/CpxP family protein refolding chaperone
MNNWKVILATVIIFGAGVLTGGLLVNHVQHANYRMPHKTAAAPASHATATNVTTNGVAHPADSAKPRLPEVLSKQFLQQLDENLHLAPEQHEAVQKLINDGQNQMRKVIQDARLEIREVLTPEQRKQFDELVKRPARKPAAATNAPVNLTNPPVVAPAVTNAPAV